MRPHPRRIARWLLVALGLCVGPVALFALLAPLFPGTPSGDLAAARVRWAANPLRHYRLEAHNSGCPLAVEVRDEQVVAVLDNPCDRQRLTVTALFAGIAEDIRQIHGTCSPNGCGCDGIWQVRVTYDDRHGYPIQIIHELDPDGLWVFTWGGLRPRVVCRLMYIGNAQATFVITPLP